MRIFSSDTELRKYSSHICITQFPELPRFVILFDSYFFPVLKYLKNFIFVFYSSF